MSVQDILAILGLLLTLLGGMWAIGKALFIQIDKRLESRFETIENNSKEWQRVEKDFLLFLAKLPLEYVRREDWVRNQSVIESKLDGLASKIEKATIRAPQTYD